MTRIANEISEYATKSKSYENYIVVAILCSFACVPMLVVGGFWGAGAMFLLMIWSGSKCCSLEDEYYDDQERKYHEYLATVPIYILLQSVNSELISKLSRLSIKEFIDKSYPN